jgi:hypothetical protein
LEVGQFLAQSVEITMAIAVTVIKAALTNMVNDFPFCFWIIKLLRVHEIGDEQ